MAVKPQLPCWRTRHDYFKMIISRWLWCSKLELFWSHSIFRVPAVWMGLKAITNVLFHFFFFAFEDKCEIVPFPVENFVISDADRDRFKKIKPPELSWLQTPSIVSVGPGRLQQSSSWRMIKLKYKIIKHKSINKEPPRHVNFSYYRCGIVLQLINTIMS